MKTHFTALLLATLLLSGHFLRADQTGSLEGQMKILARGTKQLSQQISDPAQKDATVTLLESLSKAALDAKAFEPESAASVPQGERNAFLDSYRQQLDALSAAFNEIEQKVKAGDFEGAKALLAKVNAIKKEGHNRFKRD